MARQKDRQANIPTNGRTNESENTPTCIEAKVARHTTDVPYRKETNNIKERLWRNVPDFQAKSGNVSMTLPSLTSKAFSEADALSPEEQENSNRVGKKGTKSRCQTKAIQVSNYEGAKNYKMKLKKIQDLAFLMRCKKHAAEHRDNDE